MKKSRLTKVQHTHVTETGRDCGENSPYRQWISDHGYTDNPDGLREPALANPDMLTDSLNMFPQESGKYSVGDISRKLSGMQKKVFELFVNEGFDEKEIATILGIKKSTVRTHLFRVRVRFGKQA